MKKILFTNKFWLVQSVFSGKKTQTRRIATFENIDEPNIGTEIKGKSKGRKVICNGLDIIAKSQFGIGEVVAIAQSYKDAGWNADTLQEADIKTPTIFPDLDDCEMLCGLIDLPFKYHKGWNNKMFVRADLMPHHIKITRIKVERLQDISSDDCLREGIDRAYLGYYVNGLRTRNWEKESHVERDGKTYKLFPTPQDAFASLIDKVCGKDTWKRNPLVFVYDFKLID